MMKARFAATALALTLMMAGCARSDMPISRFEIASPGRQLAQCLYRDGTERTIYGQKIEIVHLTDPEEWRVSKIALSGNMVWEFAVSDKAGGSVVIMRHRPSIVGWDENALITLNACTGGPLLRRV